MKKAFARLFTLTIASALLANDKASNENLVGTWNWVENILRNLVPEMAGAIILHADGRYSWADGHELFSEDNKR